MHAEILPHRKSKTPTGPDNSEPKPSDVKSHVIHEQERRARQEAEKAAKVVCVFHLNMGSLAFLYFLETAGILFRMKSMDSNVKL